MTSSAPYPSKADTPVAVKKYGNKGGSLVPQSSLLVVLGRRVHTHCVGLCEKERCRHFVVTVCGFVLCTISKHAYYLLSRHCWYSIEIRLMVSQKMFRPMFLPPKRGVVKVAVSEALLFTFCR